MSWNRTTTNCNGCKIYYLNSASLHPSTISPRPSHLPSLPHPTRLVRHMSLKYSGTIQVKARCKQKYTLKYFTHKWVLKQSLSIYKMKCWYVENTLCNHLQTFLVSGQNWKSLQNSKRWCGDESRSSVQKCARSMRHARTIIWSAHMSSPASITLHSSRKLKKLCCLQWYGGRQERNKVKSIFCCCCCSSCDCLKTNLNTCHNKWCHCWGFQAVFGKNNLCI